VTSVVFAFAAFFVVLSFMLLIVIFLKRETRTIKAASFLFCVLSITGGIVVLLCVFFFDTGSNGNVPCYLALWLACIGFTMLFGSSFLKNYRIFLASKTLSKLNISDKILSMVLAALVGIDLILLIIFQAVAPDCRSVDTDPFKSPSGSTVIYVVLALYKLILLLSGCYIAFKSRAVINVAQYSERHQLGYSIYNLAIVTAIIIPATYLLRNSPTSAYVLRAVGIFIGIVVCLSVLYLPKIFVIYGFMGEEDAVASNNTNAGTKSNNDHKKAVGSNPASRAPLSLSPSHVGSSQQLIPQHRSSIEEGTSIQSTH